MSHPEADRPESTFRPALLLMFGRAIASIATLLIPVTLVRLFGQAEYGTYKQLFLIFTTLYSIALVGLSDSLYYFVPKDPGKGGGYVANAIAGLAVAGALCLAGLLALSHRIGEWMKNEALSDYLGAIGVFLFFTLLSTVLEIALIARKRYLVASGAYVASDIARALFFVVPMLFVPGLPVLMRWAMVYAACRFGIALWLLRREFGETFRIDPRLMAVQAAYAGPFALYVLVEILQSTFHQYAVSWTFDAATFAIYSVGCFQVPFVDFLATPASSVMMVRMSEEIRDGRPSAALSIWLDITRKLALLFFPMVALLMATSHDVITFLFTDAYAASSPIFALWVLTIALSVLQTDGVMRVHAQIRFLLLVNILRLGLIVALIRPLMTAFGLLGPVLVTLLAMAVAKGLHLFRMGRVMHLSPSELLPWKSLGAVFGASALAVVPTLAVHDLISGPRLAVLLAEGAVFVIAYVGILLVAGILTPHERTSLKHWLRFQAAVAPSSGALR